MASYGAASALEGLQPKHGVCYPQESAAAMGLGRVLLW